MISGTRYQLRLETNRQLRLAGEIARAQTEISTGKKILAPSDNPAAAARISDIARTQANQATWRGNLDKAASLGAQADDVLKALGIAFTRASELMVSGANSTRSIDDQRAIALEMDSIAEQVATLRNTRDSRGELLFPVGAATRIPVGPGLELAAVGTQDQIFDNIATPTGASDLETILRDAAAALRGGNPTAIGASMDQVNAAGTHVATVHAEQGARSNRIDDLIEQSESFEIVVEEERKGLESADIAEVVARLQAKELSLEAAQAAFARINRSNLFDLIR